MKQHDLDTVREWKLELELASRRKPIGTAFTGQTGPYHTPDTRLAENRAELLGRVLDEFVHLPRAIKIYEEACGLNCVCSDDSPSDCRHCHLVHKAHLEMGQLV